MRSRVNWLRVSYFDWLAVCDGHLLQNVSQNLRKVTGSWNFEDLILMTSVKYRVSVNDIWDFNVVLFGAGLRHNYRIEAE
jgi:hypothetical protein